jgi:hypothetical protein
MTEYQKKWIEVLENAHIPGWKIEALGNAIQIDMPNVAELKLIRDNLPETLGLISLDIEVPKERLELRFHNGHESFEYILNPAAAELTSPGRD